MRSDARRNRARLIEVAATAFRDEGLDIGVDELARRAEVGIATLYRHFPAKTDLIVAVMDRVFADLSRAADEALARPAGACAFRVPQRHPSGSVPEPRLPRGLRAARPPS